MADKRKEIETNLAKQSQAKDRITAQLEEAEAKVKQLQSVVNAEMFENGSSSSLQELSLTREKVTSLHQTEQFANGQVNQARQALADYDMTIKGGQVMELDKKLIQSVLDLQAKLGENDLMAEVDKLHELIMQMEKLSADRVLDVGMHLQSARSIYIDLANFLFKTWKAIDQLKWGPAHGADPKEPGHIPGFGMIPGYTKSA